ncbi:hypothetical protein B6D29_02540 [Microgenomates bacterium UTCPR1]|nr:MAG: hypothetical protein B6D29_02540 [Microgenomates bacterium UTCPR1]
MQKIFVNDPTKSDGLSSVRGVGRYLQILKENFSEWTFTDKPVNPLTHNSLTVFINPFFNFLQRPVTMKRIAEKQVAVIHDLIPLKYPDHFPIGIKGKVNTFLNKLALKNYDLVVTDSEASKKDIINILKLPENKIKVIYPCLPKTFLTPSPTTNHPPSLKLRWASQPPTFVEASVGKPTTNHYLLYVGDATWNKNLVNLAKAIKTADVNCVFAGKIFSNRPPLTTNLYSHPWQKELKDFFQEIGSDKRFIFPGFVSDTDLFSLYKNAVANILPSRDEGFGFSYLEASQFSCPSILANIPILKEISNGNALFVNAEDPKDIAQKIKTIVKNKKLRKDLVIKAKERSAFFSPTKFKKSFFSLLLG